MAWVKWRGEGKGLDKASDATIDQKKPEVHPLKPEVGSFAVDNALKDSKPALSDNSTAVASTPEDDAQAAQRILDAQQTREEARTIYFG